MPAPVTTVQLEHLIWRTVQWLVLLVLLDCMVIKQVQPNVWHVQLVLIKIKLVRVDAMCACQVPWVLLWLSLHVPHALQDILIHSTVPFHANLVQLEVTVWWLD